MDKVLLFRIGLNEGENLDKLAFFFSSSTWRIELSEDDFDFDIGSLLISSGTIKLRDEHEYNEPDRDKAGLVNSSGIISLRDERKEPSGDIDLDTFFLIISSGVINLRDVHFFVKNVLTTPETRPSPRSSSS